MAIIYAAVGNQCACRANPHAKWIYSNRSCVPGGEDRYKLRCLARRGVTCYTMCLLPIILPTYTYLYVLIPSQMMHAIKCNCESKSKTEGIFSIYFAIGCQRHFFANARTHLDSLVCSFTRSYFNSTLFSYVIIVYKYLIKSLSNIWLNRDDLAANSGNFDELR